MSVKMLASACECVCVCRCIATETQQHLSGCVRARVSDAMRSHSSSEAKEKTGKKQASISCRRQRHRQRQRCISTQDGKQGSSSSSSRKEVEEEEEEERGREASKQARKRERERKTVREDRSTDKSNSCVHVHWPPSPLSSRFSLPLLLLCLLNSLWCCLVLFLSLCLLLFLFLTSHTRVHSLFLSRFSAVVATPVKVAVTDVHSCQLSFSLSLALVPWHRRPCRGCAHYLTLFCCCCVGLANGCDTHTTHCAHYAPLSISRTRRQQTADLQHCSCPCIHADVMHVLMTVLMMRGEGECMSSNSRAGTDCVTH